jgi:putative transposase
MSDARYRRSAGGVGSLGVHRVSCAKYRRRLFGGRVAVGLEELVDEIAVENEWRIVTPEVMADHVPILVRVGATDSPAEVTRSFNRETSGVLAGEFGWLGRKRVLWSKSYVAASVGSVSQATVGRCIERRWDAVG